MKNFHSDVVSFVHVVLYLVLLNVFVTKVRLPPTQRLRTACGESRRAVSETCERRRALLDLLVLAQQQQRQRLALLLLLKLGTDRVLVVCRMASVRS